MGNWTSKVDWSDISQTKAGRKLLYKNILIASKIVDKFCRLRPPANLTSFVKRYKREFLGGMMVGK
jgi:hypothetical protein